MSFVLVSFFVTADFYRKKKIIQNEKDYIFNTKILKFL